MQIVTSTTPSGIRTRTASVPGRCYGALTFAVSARDEPVELRGITHLALHLVEAALSPAILPTASSIDEQSITFSASGTVAQVTRHLAHVADAVIALGGVTTFELARAKHLLALEEPSDVVVPGVDLLTYRYGLGEIGRNGFGMPAVSGITKKQLKRWAATWFTAENAAISLTKPLPASFDIALPEGDRPARATPAEQLSTPTLVASENRGVTASLVVPTAGAEQLADVLERAIRERIVERAGLAHHVELGRVRVDESTEQLDFTVDVDHGDVAEATRILVNCLRDIADDGVSAAVLTLAVEYTRLALAADPDSVLTSLTEADDLELRGFTAATREERLAAATSLTLDSVAAAVTAALPSLIVAFDDSVSLKKVAKSLDLPIEHFELLGVLPEKVWKKAAKGARVFEAKKSADWDDAGAIVTDEHLLVRSEDVGVTGLALGDLAIVGEGLDGTLVLVDSAGRWLPFDPSDWKQGRSFVKALRAAVQPDLVVPFAGI